MKKLFPNPLKSHGFALVVTLSLMILLTLVAVGLLSLATVSMRSSSQAKAEAEAKSNARLALMIALGELQKQMGPDQRISASGAITDPDPLKVKHPHWTGVWNSWKAGTGELSQHSTIGSQPDSAMRPTYQTRREDYFRSWLLSLDPSEAKSVTSPLNLSITGSSMPEPGASAVELVGKGSLGTNSDPKDYVSARLLPLKASTGTNLAGRYGWWVGDESQKARIMDDSYKTSRARSLADRLSRQQAPASMGNSIISGLENIADETSLAFMPSRSTLPLVKGATTGLTEQFHDISTATLGVLADVREGGLKRDLSTILERKIDPEEVYNLTPVTSSDAGFKRASSIKSNGNDFMLYRFDNMVNSTNPTGEACVPIQDLAAYYQLYDRYRTDSKGGIQYSSSESSPPNSNLRNGIMVSNPDYGSTQTDLDKYLRQYTALYTCPIPVKIEIMLSYVTEPIVPEPTAPNADKYRLRIGISPAMTFWNPNNVPLVMNIGDPELASLMIRETPMPLKVTIKKSDSYSGPPRAKQEIQFNRVTRTQQGELYTLFVSGKYPTVFQPGESKVFALRFASNTDSNSASNYADFYLRGTGYRYSEPFVPELELVPGWNPEKFVRPAARNSDGAAETVFTFKEGDYISASIDNGDYNSFAVDFTQKSRHGRNAPGVKWHFRSFGIMSRFDADASYKNSIVYQGFPLNGANVISDSTMRTIEVPAREAQKLIDAMGSKFNPRDDLPQPFFYYAIKAATETHESNNSTGPSDGAGRRFPSRPFTHSTAMTPGFLDSTDPRSLYNYGWNWFFMPLDNLADAPIEISRGNSGYYGGGYTAENGTTHIVQQQLPAIPPMSIASLSPAHLGGFSLATEAPAEGYTGLGDRNSERFHRTTAIGFDGLAPHALQAIGNSYAHPNIPPDKAVTTWERQFQGSNKVKEPFVDHSYLANKALWDEFFFSSISPKPSKAKVFSEAMTAAEMARDFFFNDKPLPNPRIVPHKQGFDQDQLDKLFTNYGQLKGGFADKIAAHLMVEGPFNVNSTSVTAWKALFSSLKEHQVTYLDTDSALVVGMNLDYDRVDGVPIPGGPLPNGKAYKNSSSDPSDREQWTGFRELTETEIEELAEAMVRQVKLRGPFLSLSEFVNRRLDGSSSAKEFALKGALQAALDDRNVSINKGFRQSPREFTNREKSFMNAAFPEAMDGPVAYGSSAYVDQADILQSFPAQLTPRGDTFVIRAYGDSLDGGGKVTARAWCEAVVQRLPEYTDPADNPEVRQADLTSKSNQNFGRKLAIVQFRWLNSSEI